MFSCACLDLLHIWFGDLWPWLERSDQSKPPSVPLEGVVRGALARGSWVSEGSLTMRVENPPHPFGVLVGGSGELEIAHMQSVF